VFRTKTGKESSDGSSSLESGCALPGLYLYYATYNDLFLMYPPRCAGRAGLRSRKRGNGNCCRVGAFGEYLYRRNYCPGRNDVVLATLAKTENRPVGARFQRARLNDCIDFLAGTGRVGNAPLPSWFAAEYLSGSKARRASKTIQMGGARRACNRSADRWPAILIPDAALRRSLGETCPPLAGHARIPAEPAPVGGWAGIL